MDGVDVVACVVHVDAVTLALLEMKCGGGDLARHGIASAVNCPTIESFFGGVLFSKGHVERFVWGSSTRTGFCETHVVPTKRRRGDPLGLPLVACVFHDNSHSMRAIIVIEIAQDPDTGMIHLDGRGDAFSSAKPEDGHFGGIRHRISIERDELERVTGQRQAANFCSASVEDMKQDAFALLYANGLAVSEHASVDREGAISDFVAVGHAFGKRGFHGSLAGFPEGLVGSGRSKEIHGHISAAAEGGLEFLEREKNFTVIFARFLARLNVDRTDLATVLSGGQIGSGAIVRVVEAEADWLWCEDDAALAMSRDEGSAFFGGAVHVNRNLLAVPMQLLGRVGVVVEIDRDLLAFLEAK